MTGAAGGELGDTGAPTPRRRLSARKRVLFALLPLLLILGGGEAFFRVREALRLRRRQVRATPRVPWRRSSEGPPTRGRSG